MVEDISDMIFDDSYSFCSSLTRTHIAVLMFFVKRRLFANKECFLLVFKVSGLIFSINCYGFDGASVLVNDSEFFQDLPD